MFDGKGFNILRHCNFERHAPMPKNKMSVISFEDLRLPTDEPRYAKQYTYFPSTRGPLLVLKFHQQFYFAFLKRTEFADLY
jgi:hypothetical protein